MASSSSSLLSLPRNWKHHLFPSFHGADVRKSFLSHLLKEFRSKAIDPFIDNNIDRSKSIGPELIEAIKGSRIAIVLLSKNYASSTWCLDELVKIIKCRKEFGQTVMTLFYDVDPTDVKKQSGDFGEVFIKTCKGKTDEDIERWKQALGEVATIAGYHSRSWNDEAEMIEKIATDVSNALNNSTLSTDFDSLVGMESHMYNMKALLRPDLEKVRMIGIYGASGIGKTAIARSLFNQYSKDFPHSVFMENVKRVSLPGYSDDYSVKLSLQKKFMSEITNDEGSNVPNLGVIKDRFKDKKVLVVLDDVDRPVQLEAMAKETSWFGHGSRIIITTQDRKILQASGVNHTYKVGLPSGYDAFQMFCMYAFGHKHPKDGFSELAWEVTQLAGKLPLGLRVMGSYFRGKSSQEDWKKALPRLKTSLDGEIESVLKFSYDALDDEDKNLFLHIACFFSTESIDIVEACLANSLLVSNVTHGLDVLDEKSLISLDGGKVGMHNLLIRLGREIVRRQFVSEPGKRQFLVDTKDIDEVLSDDKADSRNVIGIDISTFSDINEDIAFTSERIFERLSNLQFLRVRRSVTLRSIKTISRRLSINTISRRLRYLNWDMFPFPCFPSDFQPKFLVKLRMQRSHLEKLWDGIQQLSNLKWMDLERSECLKVLPDLSNAINLCELSLWGCSSLVKLPCIGNAIHLRKLYLTSCSNLVKLHSSVGSAIHLRELDFTDCINLVKLPSSIGNLINLEELSLRDCSSLVKLPSSIGNLINLKKLVLKDCSLVKLPSSMINLCRLSQLVLLRCSKLAVCLTNINLESLEYLHISKCSLLKIEDSKLSEMELSSCETQELGPWTGRISRLRQLVLDDMQNLVSLPQLPYSIEELDAVNCESLERLDCSFRNPNIRLNFGKCFKLNQEARDLIIQTRTNKYAVLPGGEVPACFTYRASESSLIVKLNQKPLGTSTKFKACFIVASESYYLFGREEIEVYCSITSKQNDVTAIPLRVLPFMEHMYIFEVEVEEVTSTELVFEFELYSLTPYNYKKVVWKIKECGVMQLLEVPSCDEHYKRFRDGDEDSDMERQILKRKVDREACGE